MGFTHAALAERTRLVARGLKLEYFTIGYNLLEALVGLIAGFLAGSIALIGFSFDSLIEVTSGAALLWRRRNDVNEHARRRIERISLRIVGVCFLALAAYITHESLTSLLYRQAPEESLPGIILGIVSLIVMPILAREKRKVAAGIRSDALAADARQTDFCFYLSSILVGGLVLNATLGWWWADPVAGLAMVPIIFLEGRRALGGKSCGCTCPSDSP